MIRVTVILKSGKEFRFDALEVSVEHSIASGAISKFEWVEAKDRIPLHVVLSEIAAIYYEKLPEGM